jgi:hypothetical protein
MPKFKHGTAINKIRRRKNGTLHKYIRFTAGPLRGKYVHRVIVEARIGRPLCDWEEVDHKDGNTLNDAPSNLSDPMTTSQHMEIENARRKAKRIASTRKAVQVEVKLLKRGAAATDFQFGENEQ